MGRGNGVDDTRWAMGGREAVSYLLIPSFPLPGRPACHLEHMLFLGTEKYPDEQVPSPILLLRAVAASLAGHLSAVFSPPPLSLSLRSSLGHFGHSVVTPPHTHLSRRAINRSRLTQPFSMSTAGLTTHRLTASTPSLCLTLPPTIWKTPLTFLPSSSSHPSSPVRPVFGRGI